LPYRLREQGKTVKEENYNYCQILLVITVISVFSDVKFRMVMNG